MVVCTPYEPIWDLPRNVILFLAPSPLQQAVMYCWPARAAQLPKPAQSCVRHKSTLVTPQTRTASPCSRHVDPSILGRWQPGPHLILAVQRSIFRSTSGRALLCMAPAKHVNLEQKAPSRCYQATAEIRNSVLSPGRTSQSRVVCWSLLLSGTQSQTWLFKVESPFSD